MVGGWEYKSLQAKSALSELLLEEHKLTMVSSHMQSHSCCGTADSHLASSTLSYSWVATRKEQLMMAAWLNMR